MPERTSLHDEKKHTKVYPPESSHNIVFLQLLATPDKKVSEFTTPYNIWPGGVGGGGGGGRAVLVVGKGGKGRKKKVTGKQRGLL